MLNAAAISALEIESSTLKLFNEFLQGFFDGASHAVGYHAPVAFPLAELRFQQSAHTAPLNGVGIAMVWVTGALPKYHWEMVTGQRQQMALMRAHWMFFVRAQLVETGSGNAKAVVQNAAERLFGLLSNSAAVKPLGQKGIHRLRPSAPQLISEGNGAVAGDPTFAMRLVACSGSLRYPVLSQP
jgi:hypothetical protein